MSDSKRLRFFKFFLHPQSKDRLRIPPAYLKHIRGRKARFFHLSGPSGDTWRVSLTKGDSNNFYFEYGWPRFVKDHSIGNGDLMIFKDVGESNFKVEIFDCTGCPKEAAFHAQCSGGTWEAEKLKKRKAMNPGNSSPDAAGRSCDRNPHFVTTINNSHKRFGYLNIPMRFARSNGLLDKHLVILIDPSGAKWPVELRLRDCPNLLNMYHGWREFHTHNNLKVGDICMFQLLPDEQEADSFSMAVHINKVPDRV